MKRLMATRHIDAEMGPVHLAEAVSLEGMTPEMLEEPLRQLGTQDFFRLSAQISADLRNIPIVPDLMPAGLMPHRLGKMRIDGGSQPIRLREEILDQGIAGLHGSFLAAR